VTDGEPGWWLGFYTTRSTDGITRWANIHSKKKRLHVRIPVHQDRFFAAPFLRFLPPSLLSFFSAPLRENSGPILRKPPQWAALGI
jgi:hypothetical protein